ncbi:hypothetical protein [Rhodoblastus sp.]|uniref:hypothetical protein n=1 Tax=Rhodoblastus sp. TaxID=1962975 RepID=UPI0025DE902E|nr:hypothetical protein [Rhodoblastus sp.]
MDEADLRDRLVDHSNPPRRRKIRASIVKTLELVASGGIADKAARHNAVDKWPERMFYFYSSYVPFARIF